MNHTLYAIALFAVSIACLALGNTLLKIGMDHFGSKTAGGASFLQALLHSPQLPLGVVLMIVQFVGTLILFKWGWDVSVVIPVMGLSYVVTAILGKLMLGEPVHVVRWMGIGLIMAGVLFVGAVGKVMRHVRKIMADGSSFHHRGTSYRHIRLVLSRMERAVLP